MREETDRMIRFAFLNVIRQRRRSMLAMLAIAAGITALILASGFIEWGFWFGRESTIHSQLGHIRIFKKGFLESGSAEPLSYLLPQNGKYLEKIKTANNVRLVAPRLAFTGLISHGDTTISFLGEGVDPDREQALSRSVTIVAGQSLSSLDPKGIIVGQGLAANLGVKPGDKLVLLVNSSTGGINAIEGHVRGLFATITKAFDDSALRVPITLSRELLRVSGSHSYAILLDKTEHTDGVVTYLRQQFQGEPIEVIPWWQMADFYNKTVELFSKQVNVIRTIIALIIVLSISNSLMTNVMERTREIGTMMALGTKRGAVMRLFLLEGTMLGVLGGGVGIIAGCLAAIGISYIGIPMPPPPGMASAYTAEIMLTWPIVMNASVLAILTTLFASVYPAWRASRTQIVSALRYSR